MIGIEKDLIRNYFILFELEKLEITLFYFLFSMNDIWIAKDTLKNLN